MKQRIDYDIYSERNFPISTINKFLISLYYTTVIENLVRAPEVYTNLKINLLDNGRVVDKSIRAELYGILNQYDF